MKNLYRTLFLVFFFITAGSLSVLSQTAHTTVTYSGFQACGGCAVCGADYWCTNTPGSYCGDTPPCITKTFFDPVPAGNTVTSVTINYYTGSCYGAAIYGTINGFAVPVSYDGNSGCLCSSNPCVVTSSVTASYPCGLPGYVYGGNNTFQLCSSNDMCINRAEFVFTYYPTEIVIPTITPSGPTTFCPGGSVSLDAGSGFAAYHWNTGETTQAITVSTSGTYTVSVTGITGCTTNVASIDVTVQDNQVPTITCPADIIVDNISNLCSVVVNYATPTATDNCPSATIEQIAGIPSGDSFPVGITTNTFRVTDIVGNTNTCSFTVSVYPLPEPITVSGGGSQCGGSMTLTASSDSGVAIYWQGTTSNGTSSDTPSTMQVITASGTYYFNSLTSDGCWTASEGITATIAPIPPDPAIVATPSAVCSGGPSVLSASVPGSAILWYTGSCGGTLIGMGNNITVNPLTATTYYARAYSSAGCWSTGCNSIAVTIKPDPVSVTVSGGGTICSGNSATLTATGGTGGTIYWQGTSSNGTSTNTPSATQNVTASGTYYFRAYNGCVWGPEGSATVTVITIPGVVTVSGGGSICSGGSATLVAGGGTGGAIYWQGTVSGGTSTLTPSTSQIISSTGTYYFRAYNTCGWSTQGSATVTVNALPAAPSPAASPNPLCSGASSTLSAAVSGSIIYWYTGSCGGISIGSGSPVVVSPTSATTYYARAYNATTGCWSGSCGSVIVAMISNPGEVTVNGGGTQCTSATLAATGGTGGTIYWQGTTGNGTSTASPSTSQTVTASGTYYFRAYNSCLWGTQGSATVTINNVPGAVMVSGGGGVCSGNSATLTASGGTAGTIYWQGTTSGGTSTDTPSTTQVFTASGTYYFRALNNCGWSAQGSATVTVNALPADPSPAASPASICSGGSTTLSAAVASSVIYWYTGSCGGTLIGTGSPKTVSPAVTTTYYARAYNATTGCWSSGCGSVTVSLNVTPGVVTVSGGGTFCTSATLTASGGTDGTIYWQGTTSGGTSSATPSTSQVVTASGTYYFRAYNSCIWGTQGSATVTLSYAPGAVSVSGAGGICSGSTATLTASGGTGGAIYWQGTTNGGTSTGSAASMQTVTATGIYYFRAYNNCGWGAQGSAVVNVNPLPSDPSPTASPGSICSGGSTTLSAAVTSSVIYWYIGSCGGTLIGTGSPRIVSPAVTTTYYARAYNATTGCWSSGCGSVTVSLNVTPGVVTVSGGGTFCTSATLTASGGTDGTIYWQGTTSGGTSSATPSASQVVTASGTYYFRAYNSCIWGAQGSATVTINNVPAMVAVSGGGSICGGNSLTLTATGGTGGVIYWQGTTSGGTSTFTPSTTQVVTASGTYYYRANNACGWGAQGSTTVTVNALPSDPTPAAAPLAICSGGISTLSATVSGAVIYWYTGSCGGTLIGTGNTLPVTIAATTTYYARAYNSTIGCWSAGCGSVTVTLGTVSTPVPVATPSAICESGSSTLTASVPGATINWYSGSCGGTPIAAGTNSVVVAPATTTTYYARAYSGSCAPSACGNITVIIGSYVTQTITGASPICAGATATWASTSPGGTWTSSDPSIAMIDMLTGTITGIAAGTALITYSVTTGGCINTATKTVTIEAPNSQVISGTTPLCIGSAAIWTSTNTGGTWGSSNSGVATINPSTGLVTGIAAGTALITYTVTTGVCVNTATTTVTITAPITQTITGTNPLCIGSTATWSGTSTGGTWSSSEAGVASINPATGLITGVTVGTSVITYTVTTAGGCVSTATRTVTVTTSVPQTITGNTPICVGSSTTWTSTTPGGIWSSENQGIAASSPLTGSITGVSAGTSLISYAVTTGGCVNTATQIITVIPANTITPANSGTQVVNINTPVTTTNFTTTGATGATVAGLPAGVIGNWASDVVTISGTPSEYGTFTYTVTTIGGCGPVTATGTIIVTTPYPSIATIGSVSGLCPGDPAVVDITLNNFIDDLVAFQFTIRYDTNYLHLESISDWAAGITGVGILHYYYGSIDAITFTWFDEPVFVNNLFFRLNFIYKAPTSGCHPVVWSDVPTQRLFGDEYFNEIGVTYLDGSVCGPDPETISGTPAICLGSATSWVSTTGGGTWTSSNPAVATVDGSSGLITGITAGSSVITYTVTKDGCVITATKTVTVNVPAAQTISGNTSVCVGSVSTLSSTTAGGSWTSSDPLVASIDVTTGILNGISSGTSLITYSVIDGLCPVTATQIVTISESVPQTITGTASICIGGSETWSGTTAGGTWSGSDPAVAAVDPAAGVVTGIAAGTSLITYSVTTGGCVNTAVQTVTVIAPLPQTISGTTPICLGASETWTVTTSGGTWTSSDPLIAEVDPSSGVVTGISAGSAIITYSITTSGVCVNTATQAVSVTAPVSQIITGTTPLCAGSTAVWSATTTGGIWTSATPSVTDIDANSGLITGVSAGTSVITYTLISAEGCVTISTEMVTITDPVAQTITGAASLCTGSTETWTSTTIGGTWASGSPGVATIDAVSGLITGVSEGTAEITYLVTTSGGCANLISQTVTVKDPVTQVISGTASICVGTVTLWTSTNSGGTWSSGMPGIADVDAGSGLVTGISAGTSEIIYTVDIGGCVNTATQTVTVLDTVSQPVIGTTPLCVGASAIWASATSGGTWTSGDPGVAIVDAASGLVTGLSAGTSVITHAVTAVGGCVYIANQTVTITAPITQTIAGATTLCAGHTATLISTTLGGNWTSGSPAVASIDEATGLLTGLSAGYVVIGYNVAVGGCVNTATQTITITAPIPQVISGSNPLCVGSSAIWTSTTPGGTWSSSDLMSAGIDNVSGLVIGMSAGTSVITYTVTTFGGCIITATKTATVLSPVTATLSGGNSPICDKTNPGIFTASASGGMGTYTYQWYKTSTGMVNGATNSTYNPGMMSSSNGFYCRVTSNPCASVNTPTFYVVVTPQVGTPTPITISSGTEPVCQLSNNSTITTYHTTATNNLGFHWSISNLAAGSIDTATGVMTWADGFYGTVNIQVFARGCGLLSPQVTRTVTVTMIPLAEAGTIAIYTGTPVMIGDAGNGPGTISWAPAAGLNSTAIAQPTASPAATTTYTLSINNNGCISTDTVTVIYMVTGHNISGKTRYAGKANNGNPVTNPPYYNSVIYDIDNVIVKLKSYPAGLELARDTSDALGNYQFTGVLDGNYMLSYDKYTADTMQWVNGVDAIDVTLLKYFLGIDTLVNPSRCFSAKYKKAANVDNNSSINAIDISRIKAKIGSPYLTSKNFPKGNWVDLDTVVTMAGSDLNIDLKTIGYGDYNASSSKYRDSTVNWSMAKSIPQNIIVVSDEYVTTSDPSYFEIPLRISTKMKEFSALGLELNYPGNHYQLVSASMAKNKKAITKINPTLDEIITEDNDLLATDENGVIRVVYATTHYYDVDANDEIITLGFRSVKELTAGEFDFELNGTGVIGNQYGEEDPDAYLVMPKVFLQGDGLETGFDFSGYPNPFDGEVILTYILPEEGLVKLNVYNSIGEQVGILTNELNTSGKHVLTFSAENLPAGMYTFKLEFTGQGKSKCMVLKLVH